VQRSISIELTVETIYLISAMWLSWGLDTGKPTRLEMATAVLDRSCQKLLLMTCLIPRGHLSVGFPLCAPQDFHLELLDGLGNNWDLWLDFLQLDKALQMLLLAAWLWSGTLVSHSKIKSNVKDVMRFGGLLLVWTFQDRVWGELPTHAT
jgi:hypothetical protein